MNVIQSLSSALSPSVKRLICDIGCSGDEQASQNKSDRPRQSSFVCFCDDGSMDVHVIAALLPQVLADELSSEYFENSTSNLAVVFNACKHRLMYCSDDEIQTLLTKLKWMNCEKILLFCIPVLRYEDEYCPKTVLILLLITAALEKALGNVFMLKGSHCPSMLKDLLLTTELMEILGPSVIKLLHVLIGPPASLNLRNVAWHGFLGDNELSNRYCCFLVLLAASIGNILLSKGISNIPQRPFVSWKLSLQSKVLTHPLNAGTADIRENLECLQKYLEKAWVIVPETKQQWQLLFILCEEGRYGFCLTLLLPLLEHCLRRVFAAVNNCPERILTAESCTLYTTFTEMLDQNLPDGTANKLLLLLTEPCMDLLQDMLFYPHGPRVRDHISHGEVDLDTVDYTFVSPFLCIAAHTASKVSPAEVACGNVFIQEMIGRVTNYRSHFHPVAVLQEKFADLLQLTINIHCDTNSSLDLKEGSEADTSVDFGNNTLLSRVQEEIGQLWKSQQWKLQCPIPKETLLHRPRMLLESLKQISDKHIQTLFRWQVETLASSVEPSAMKESEYVGLLLRIVQEISTALRQVQLMQEQRRKQLLGKELRSRQRENLRKLLLCTPCLQILVGLLAVVIGRHVQYLQDYATLSAEHRKRMQKHLKTLLRHCENMRTLTASDKNKWTESVELLLSLLPSLELFVQQFYQHERL